MRNRRRTLPMYVGMKRGTDLVVASKVIVKPMQEVPAQSILTSNKSLRLE